MRTYYFDLFKIDSVGPLWLSATASLEEAKAKAALEHSRDPNCDFKILNQRTGVIQTIFSTELGGRTATCGN
jgi:hypothetical protein